VTKKTFLPKEDNYTDIAMPFSDLWAQAQASRSDAFCSFIVNAWCRLFGSAAARHEQPIGSAPIL